MTKLSYMKKTKASIILLIGIGQTVVCVWLALLFIPIAFAGWVLQEGFRRPVYSVDQSGELQEAKTFELINN